MSIATTINSKTKDVSRHSQNGDSKVSRYGWTLTDEPGKQMYIKKELLDVDESYQRSSVASKCRAMATAWSWMACGTLLVGFRDGKYFVFDGGHRRTAAMLRSDIDELPCLVFPTIDNAHEAGAFVRANANRKPITTYQKFNALVVSGDPLAMAVSAILQESGYSMAAQGGRPGTIRCIGVMLKEMTRRRPTFEKIWPLVVEISNGQYIPEVVITSLCYIESRLEKREETISLTRNPWKPRLAKLGIEGIVAGANDGAKFFKRGGERAWSIGVLESLSKGCRHRLSLSDNGDDE